MREFHEFWLEYEEEWENIIRIEEKIGGNRLKTVKNENKMMGNDEK